MKTNFSEVAKKSQGVLKYDFSYYTLTLPTITHVAMKVHVTLRRFVVLTWMRGDGGLV